MFLPHLQSPERRMNLVVRTVGDPTQLAPAVRNEIRSIDKSVLIYGGSTLESVIARGMAQRRFQTWLLTAVSALALLLASVRIYRLLHPTVILRTRRSGMRMALRPPP